MALHATHLDWRARCTQMCAGFMAVSISIFAYLLFMGYWLPAVVLGGSLIIHAATLLWLCSRRIELDGDMLTFRMWLKKSRSYSLAEARHYLLDRALGISSLIVEFEGGPMVAINATSRSMREMLHAVQVRIMSQERPAIEAPPRTQIRRGFAVVYRTCSVMYWLMTLYAAVTLSNLHVRDGQEFIVQILIASNVGMALAGAWSWRKARRYLAGDEPLPVGGKRLGLFTRKGKGGTNSAASSTANRDPAKRRTEGTNAGTASASRAKITA